MITAIDTNILLDVFSRMKNFAMIPGSLLN